MKFITLTLECGSKLRLNFSRIDQYERRLNGSVLFFANDHKGEYPIYVTETPEEIDALLAAPPAPPEEKAETCRWVYESKHDRYESDCQIYKTLYADFDPTGMTCPLCKCKVEGVE